MGMGAGLVGGLCRCRSAGSAGPCGRLVPGPLRRWLGPRRQVLPVGVSLLRHPRLPLRRPWLPPAEDGTVALYSVTLLPLVDYAPGERSAARQGAERSSD